jgi:hypothetical protein
LIIIILVLLCKTTTAERNDDTSQTIFRELGQLKQANAIAHLSFQIDLQEYDDQCDHLHRAMDRNQQGMRQPPEVAGAWKALNGLVNNTCDQVKRLRGPHPRRDPNRYKRQIGLIIAGTIGTLFGLYEDSKIRDLTDAIHKDETHLHQHVLLLRDHELRIQRIETRLTKDESAVASSLDITESLLNREQRLAWIQELALQVTSFGAHVHRATSGIQALDQGHLTSDLLDLDQAEHAFDQAEKYASGLKGELIVDHPAALYQLPITYTTSGPFKYHVLLHLPIITETFQLLQYIPMPIRLMENDQTINIEVLPPRRLLARNERMHRELEDTDLQGCWHRERTYICSGLTAFNLNLRTTCLGALFAGEAGPIRDHCPVVQTMTSWAAEIIGQGKIALYSKDARRIQMDCAQGPTRNQEVQGNLVLPLPAGCTLSNELLRVNARTDTLIEETWTPTLSWNLSAFLPEVVTGKLDAIRTLLQQNNIKPEDDVAELIQQGQWVKELNDLQTVDEAHRTQHSILYLVSSCVIGLLVCVTMICICRYAYVAYGTTMPM